MKTPNSFTSTLKWVKDNKYYFLAIFLIVLLGGFFRLYRISDYMTFLGDEGRDALVVKRLILDGDLVFVGPGTSVGNMYLGPFYYYFMAPFLFFSNFDPVGPAVGVALLGVLTIIFVWYISYKWSGGWGSIFASFLYAISPVVIVFSKHSWNPNIMPFFSLLFIYSIWKFWYESKYNWILVASLSFAICLQSHYLSLALLPFLFVFLVLSFIKSVETKKQRKFLIKLFLSFFVFLILMSPLIIFDAKYNWRNILAMRDFFFEKSSLVSVSLASHFLRFFSVWELVFIRLITGKEVLVGKITSYVFILISILYSLYLIKKKEYSYKSLAFLFTFSWLLISVLVLSFYKDAIYDHYLGFLFPAPFLILAFWVEKLRKFGGVGIVFSFVLIFLFAVLDLLNSPLRSSPSYQMKRTIEVSKKILDESKGNKFNLAVIAERNYEGAYLYFLELWKAPVVIIDPQRAGETITEQLFVVCEYEDKNKCQPTSNPKAEVANFGWSKIDKSWEVGGVILFKLVHNPSGQPQYYEKE